MSLRAWADLPADTVFMEVRAVADTIIGAGHRLHMAAAEIFENYEGFEAYGALHRMHLEKFAGVRAQRVGGAGQTWDDHPQVTSNASIHQ